MARVRGGGGTTAYVVALALFVILFIFSLVIAILLYTRLAAADQGRIQARNELARVMAPAEKAQVEQALGANRPPGNSVVANLLADLSALKARIANNRTGSMEQITAAINAAGVPETQSLLSEIQVLRATVLDNKTQIDKFAEASKAADARAKAAETEKVTLANSYKDAVDKLQSQIAEQGRQLQAYQATVDNQRKQLEGQLASIRTTGDETTTGLRAQIDERDRTISELQGRVNDLEEKLRGRTTAGGVDSSTQPDGHISAIIAEQQMVYIDRGRSEHVLPGMTFEVYDKSGVVTKNEVGDLRGKATIEVVNVSDNSSTARIVRQQRGKAVLEGDIIVNAVYDPNVKYKFVVFGEFDIDNTGAPTVSDRRRIETMITEWGASLADNLTYDTDFLVLGQEPKLPDALPATTVDPVAIERHAAETRRYKMYQDLIQAATNLRIPILNQNRFLALVGYYRR